MFNLGENKKFSFDVNTPQFLKEACECSNGGMYPITWNIFRNLIAMVAERATEINDPILNTLMIRLNLFDLKNEDRYKIIKSLQKYYQENIIE